MTVLRFSFLVGVLLCLCLGRCLVLRGVGLEERCDVLAEWVVGVRGDEEVDDGLQHVAHGHGRLPVVRLEDVQADGALFVDVGVVDLGVELDLGCDKGVVVGCLR